MSWGRIFPVILILRSCPCQVDTLFGWGPDPASLPPLPPFPECTTPVGQVGMEASAARLLLPLYCPPCAPGTSSLAAPLVPGRSPGGVEPGRTSGGLTWLTLRGRREGTAKLFDCRLAGSGFGLYLSNHVCLWSGYISQKHSFLTRPSGLLLALAVSHPTFPYRRKISVQFVL